MIQDEDQKKVAEIPEELWLWIYVVVLAINGLIFLFIWFFSRYFSS